MPIRNRVAKPEWDILYFRDLMITAVVMSPTGTSDGARSTHRPGTKRSNGHLQEHRIHARPFGCCIRRMRNPNNSVSDRDLRRRHEDDVTLGRTNRWVAFSTSLMAVFIRLNERGATNGFVGGRFWLCDNGIPVSIRQLHDLRCKCKPIVNRSLSYLASGAVPVEAGVLDQLCETSMNMSPGSSTKCGNEPSVTFV
jgi:hypothetical protein